MGKKEKKGFWLIYVSLFILIWFLRCNIYVEIYFNLFLYLLKLKDRFGDDFDMIN